MSNAPSALCKFEDLLRNPQRLSIPGFSRQESVVARQVVFPPSELSALEWWDIFSRRIKTALTHKTFLAVYRASHGEFAFVTGKLEAPQQSWKRLRFVASRIAYSIRFLSTFYSGSRGYGYETYRWWELPRLRRKLGQQLKEFGDDLILCTYYSDRDAFPRTIQAEFHAWCVSLGIRFDSRTYGHIYFVYALFNGPYGKTIFQNRNVLIITNLSEGKQARIERALLDRGASNVRFHGLSRSHAMRDELALRDPKWPDICIVGGGVGAANILWQLKNAGFSCPCIDAGFVLDILSNPEIRKRRIYCVDDELWDSFFAEKTPSWGAAFSDKRSYLDSLPNDT